MQLEPSVFYAAIRGAVEHPLEEHSLAPGGSIRLLRSLSGFPKHPGQVSCRVPFSIHQTDSAQPPAHDCGPLHQCLTKCARGLAHVSQQLLHHGELLFAHGDAAIAKHRALVGAEVNALLLGHLEHALDPTNPTQHLVQLRGQLFAIQLAQTAMDVVLMEHGSPEMFRRGKLTTQQIGFAIEMNAKYAIRRCVYVVRRLFDFRRQSSKIRDNDIALCGIRPHGFSDDAPHLLIGKNH